MARVLGSLVGLIFLSTFIHAEKVKVGVLADIHFDPFYEPGASVSNFCKKSSNPLHYINNIERQVSVFGQFG